ncbi:MAG: cobalt chelatase [Rubrivivax sp.]
MSDVQAAVRAQAAAEELCAASIRALAHERDLHFRGRRLHRGRQRLPLFAPHLHPTVGHDDFGSFRGAADGLALRLRDSDAALHRRLAPPEPVRRLVFDVLEQFRVESRVGEVWPGVRHNLEHRFERWTAAFVGSRLHETVRGLFLFAVTQTLRARVFGQAVAETVDDLVEATRFQLAPLLGPELAQLHRLRDDQAAFAAVALRIADGVAAQLETTGEAAAGAGEADDAAAAEGDERLAFGFLLELDDATEGDALPTVVTGRSRVLEGGDGGYRVFTTAHDRELRPAAAMRREQLDEYRQQLDHRIASQAINLPRLVRQLKALLARPADDDWAQAQEEGLIDGRRLAQLIVSPTERRLFRQLLREPVADAVVTLLIDCSGSMRQHIGTVAMLVDVLARALDVAGARSEVLGFTTGSWNGGRAMRDWRRAGQPPHPGRVAELAHLVFKDADTAWRHARRDIAALLRPDLFRESVDGEALQWAAGRLRARPEPRRLLIVFSDGCPMEGATALANDAHYLDHHLQDVAAAIEGAGELELAAVGVGLDLSPYYARSQALDLDAAQGNALFLDLLRLIGRPSRR